MPLAEKNKRILFIVPYPLDSAPGQRFRFEQYFSLLEQKQLVYSIETFFNEKANSVLYSKGNFLVKFLGIIQGYISRSVAIVKSISYDYIFIFRETTPLGPPIFEWTLAKLLHKKIIYDFDDAIWLSDPTEKGLLLSKLKWKSKVLSVCRWSYKISVGNKYLADFAKKYNQNIVINPTTIDTDNVHNPCLTQERTNNEERKVVIGWTGTHSTLQYLSKLIPVLEKLENNYDFQFLVIANKNPNYTLKSFKYIPWNKRTEIEDLMKIDIGVMPLTDDEWSRGKCGFKLLQYMALEKPVLASPVGVNKRIVEDGVNGFLCREPDDWLKHITRLIEDARLREHLGKKGRVKVVNYYSVRSNSDNFLSLFE